MSSRNISTKTTAERLASLLNTYYAKKSALPTKVSDLTNDSNFQTESQVDAKISASVAGALQPAGSIAFADLPAAAAANCNKIYNITDAFTTTSDFVEGSGKSYPAGTNVAIINVGTAQSPSYKYDTYTGTFDFSGFSEKVSGATSGNFAGLDSNGNLTDSGKKAADFAAAGHTHSDKADKVSGATTGNLAGLDANGNLTDSGVAASNVMQKVASATAGNVATLNASGEAQDSGTALTDVLVASDISDYTEAELRTLLGLPAASE